jgi:hypothetical protein
MRQNRPGNGHSDLVCAEVTCLFFGLGKDRRINREDAVEILIALGQKVKTKVTLNTKELDILQIKERSGAADRFQGNGSSSAASGGIQHHQAGISIKCHAGLDAHLFEHYGQGT